MVTKGSPSCSSTCGGKPSPSSAISILTSSFDQRASTSTLLVGEVDGVLDQIAEAVDARRDCAASPALARHGRPGLMPAPVFTSIGTATSRCGATTSSIRWFNGSARHDEVVLLAHAGKLAKDVAAALGLRSEQQ